MTATDTKRAPFTLDGYAEMIRAFEDRGFRARTFAESTPTRADLLLRHDVDQCLDAACALAEIEHDNGWPSIYFILVRTDMYNVLSRQGGAQLGRLRALGREIGLHLDPSLYDSELTALDRGAAVEIAALESALDLPVAMVSFHRPAKWLQGLAAPIADRPHAYQPRYFSEIGYCSDSRGGWHHGHPLDHPAVAAGTALQLLTHAVWWAYDGSPQQRLAAVLARRERAIDRELAENCSIYHPKHATEAQS